MPNQRRRTLAQGGEQKYAFNFAPKESQQPYRQSTAMYKLGGGRRGGGKTYTLAGIALELSLDYPGNRGFIGRRDLSDFHNTTQRQLEALIPRGLCREPCPNQQHKEYHIVTAKSLETGSDEWDSLIMYGELKDPNNILSGELGWFGLEEAFEVPQASFSHLGASLRHHLPDGSFPPFFGLLMSNPSPGWLMDLFPVLPAEQEMYKELVNQYGDSFRPMKSPEPSLPKKLIEYDYAYFPFGASDIADILPPNYMHNIQRIYEREGEVMLARMVYGEWGLSIEGLVYNLLPIHRYNPLWTPTGVGKKLYQRGKPVLVGIDPSNGAGSYAATVWQVCGQRRMVVKEYKVEGATDDDFLDWLHHQPFANDISDCVVDSARPDTVKRLNLKGLPARGVGKKDVIAQISAMKELMRVDPITGEAKFVIDESECPQLVREFGLRSYKKQRETGPKVPEEPVKRYDDLLNSCEYLVNLHWPVSAVDEEYEYGHQQVSHTPLYLKRNAFYRSPARRR